VDQNSADKTTEIAKEYGAKVIDVPATDKYIPPSNSRNIGFKESHGEIIYHIDADMELDENLLSEFIEIFKDINVVAIVVPEFDVPLNIWAKAKAFERSLYFGSEMEAARVSRREVFSDVMYDTAVESGEDWNIHDQFTKNGRIARSKLGVKHHVGSLSLSREFKKKLHYGEGSKTYTKKSVKKLATTFFKLIKLYTLGIGKTIFRHPIVVIAFIIVRFVDTTALFTGLVLGKK
jgi:glycosyltransferase involved in cell wall biosynthesis